jgi:hypothetical protein
MFRRANADFSKGMRQINGMYGIAKLPPGGAPTMCFRDAKSRTRQCRTYVLEVARYAVLSAV